MPEKTQVANVGEFLGLRTDTPAEKCPSNYSPDCSDMMFSVGEMETRFPFRLLYQLPEEIVYRKQFTAKNGTTQELALGVSGALYTVAADGTTTVIDMVAPGSSCNSITAYGREYMSFFNAHGGCDAPRQWDGQHCDRVSCGGPAIAPIVTNIILPPTSMYPGGSPATGAVSSATAVDFNLINPGPHETIYWSGIQVTTAVPSGVTLGQSVTITGNSNGVLNATGTVTGVLSLTTFKISAYISPAVPQMGTGGAYAVGVAGATTISRTSNVVTVNTATAHGLQVGFQAQISGITAPSVGGMIVSVFSDNENTPGLALVTTSSAHGLVPQNQVSLLGVGVGGAGGGITSATFFGDVVTITTNSAHGLSVGSIVSILNNGVSPYYADGTWTVTAILSPTMFTYSIPGANNAGASSSGGTVNAVFSEQTPNETYQVVSCPSATSFYISLDVPDGTWTGGQATFGWNGTFYVTSVGSSTLFQYQQYGPNATSAARGTVTPHGQASPGLHQVRQAYLTRTGNLTAFGPSSSFQANGGQYLQVSQLQIGPSYVVARVLIFSGANGSRLFYIPTIPQVNGTVVGTATQVNDNTTTTILLDFADNTLFQGLAVDIPGNNLYQQTVLNLPRGVSWFRDRLFWLGEANTVTGFLNMGMDSGPLNGMSVPGWITTGTPAVIELGNLPTLQVTGPDTGQISQSAFINQAGAVIIQSLKNYSLRFWMLGTGSTVGTFVATLTSASTAFASTAQYPLASLTQSEYNTVAFSATMPSVIPNDLILTISVTGLPAGESAFYRDLQMIYADNPNRNPTARASYTANPEAYDLETATIGPSDDSSELRAIFLLQESLHFLTAQRLYSVQDIGNAEPSSWDPYQISNKCGAFNSNSVTVGKGWAAWGGPAGAFWYSGGTPEKTSSIITPTWKNVSSITSVYDEDERELVHFGVVDSLGNKSMLVYDYHERELGGSGKWCPWKRPLNWVSYSPAGAVYVLNGSFYELDTSPAVSDDDLGNISGYYTLGPMGTTMFQKDYAKMGLRITGVGVLTPFIYTTSLATLAEALVGQDLAALLDAIAEWPLNRRGRLLFLKLGQPTVQYALTDATVLYANDANSPLAGVR